MERGADAAGAAGGRTHPALTTDTPAAPIPRFERSSFLTGAAPIVQIGDGAIGGKARGLVAARAMLETAIGADGPIEVVIPPFAVIATGAFEEFLDRNDLRELALSDLPDERIAHAFQRASLPTTIAGDLHAVAEAAHCPLAVRSSSLLEDAMFRPFAGVYETKMTPNNQPDATERFRKLAEAVKLVWSSTYFRTAKDYIRTTDKTITDERMAVIIQPVVGARQGDRYYPTVSGVCRSFNYYPAARGRPEDGIVLLALGLGKTIVDGGLCWSYAPPRPLAPPPFASVRDRLQGTQARFWAIDMGKPPAFDPIAEAEYLVSANLDDAEYDGTLGRIASTYDADADRLVPGTHATGPRVLDFAPLLQDRELAFNEVVGCVRAACEEGLGTPVEIEFALTFDPRGASRPRFGFLQVRPLVVSEAQVTIDEDDFASDRLLAASTRVLGNGMDDRISDVVYVRPDRFDAQHTREIASEIDAINTQLLACSRPYLLIGFGRWGSSDPWLGIPVHWGQICGARAIVEATLPALTAELSQGSHFFHDLSSFGVSYFMIPYHARPAIDWAWLERQAAVAELGHVRHVRLPRPLLIRVDGRTGRGVILRGGADVGPS